jgi:biopolymer transport protein TolR
MAMSSGSSSSSGRRVMAEINITPFTDVCLVLLIIFMISASFLSNPKGVDVKLPQASRKATSALPTQDITISVMKNGALFVDQKSVGFTDLYSDLKTYARTTKVRNVIIKADQGILYDEVVKVMDAVRETGITYMSLAVEQAQPPRHVDTGA